MPTVSYKVGMTMHLGSPQNNEYIKMDLEAKDVDVDVDFDEQIQKIHATAIQLMTWGNEQLGTAILEALNKK